MREKRTLLFLMLPVFFGVTTGVASDDSSQSLTTEKVEVIRESKSIQSLNFSNPEVLIEDQSSIDGAKNPEITIRFQGVYTQVDGSLILDQKFVKQGGADQDAKFILLIKNPKSLEQKNFLSVGPLGEVEEETITFQINLDLVFEEHTEKLQKRQNLFREEKFTFLEGGFTNTSFRSLTFSTSQVALSGQIRYRYDLPQSRYGYQLSLGSTLLPVSGREKAYFGNTQALGYYRVPLSSSDFTLRIMMGFQIQNSFFESSDFGYYAYQFPTPFPEIEYQAADGSCMQGYVRFFPVMKGIDLNFDSYEFVLGGRYFFKQSRFGIVTEFHSLSLKNSDQISTEVQALTLGGSLSF